MSTELPKPDIHSLTNHVIIAGFGIVGRAVAESLDRQDIPFCVVELNPSTVDRVGKCGTVIIEGDIRLEKVLVAAGIDTARALALALPDESHTLAALKVARRLKPGLIIIARCVFSSAGLMAAKLGADEVIVAEQVVAREFALSLDKVLSR